MVKELLIIILGAKRIHPKLPLIKRAISKLYNFFHVSNTYLNQEKMWKRHFYSNNRDVICLHWGRGITDISRFFALKKLEKIINQYKNTREITLVGYSMGGEVALEASRRFDGIIKKALLIFSANEFKNPNVRKTKIVNIYSPYDLLVQTAIKVLAPLTGNQKLIGENITNISLNHFEHFDVFSDKKIKRGRFIGKTVPELINELI